MTFDTDNIFWYQIDSRDIIISISDNWWTFAYENSWKKEPNHEEVVGRSLWDFILGNETQHLYAEVFRKVRAGKRGRPIPFRCDSPSERRFLELKLKLLHDDQIEITSTILRTENRKPLRFIDNQTPRTTDLIRICSMCKKIDIAQNQWLEIEEALGILKLFEEDKVPSLTHGLCPDCYRVALADLE